MQHDTPERELTELVDAARHDLAVQQRSRERWLRQQAAEEARLSGVLLDAAEQRATVTLRTRAGRQHVGRINGVGRDVCVMSTAAGVVYVRLSAVTVIRPEQGQPSGAAADDRVGPLDLSFDDILAQQCAEEPDVFLVLAGDGDGINGRLLSVGADVVTVAVTGSSVAYVASDAIEEASLC